MWKISLIKFQYEKCSLIAMLNLKEERLVWGTLKLNMKVAPSLLALS
jgi:hypothetical protein